MEKRKCLTFLFCLILCYFLFQHTATAQSSSQVSIFSQGSITHSPSKINLAVIPDDWHLTYGSGPQIIYLDYSVVRTAGKPSIRLEPHTTADANIARECDGTWYSTKPGDHIVFKCWIKTDNNNPTEDASIYQGARIGIDLCAPTGTSDICIVDSYPHSGQEQIDGIVRWNTSNWTLKTWDIIIPSTIYTQDVHKTITIPPSHITQFVPWIQGCQIDDGNTFGNAWFADAELYINPP